MGDSKAMTISQGHTIKTTFKNHSDGASNWNNWLVRLSGTTGVNHTFRADNYVVGDNDSKESTRSIKEDGGDINWTDFCADMKDSEVEMTITYTAGGMFSINATSTGANHAYSHTFAYNEVKSGDVTVELGVDKAWLEVLSVEKTVPATIGADGYATFSSAYALDFTGTGIDAYIAKTSETAGVVDMQKVTKAPANTGLFLKGATANVPVTTAATDDVTDNLLVPTTGADIPVGAYVLAKQGGNVAFYQLTSALSGVAAGKAYLNIPSSAKSFALNFGDATGIESLRQATKEGEGQWFNLAGQRVAQPTKGLYIVNGKKVSVK